MRFFSSFLIMAALLCRLSIATADIPMTYQAWGYTSFYGGGCNGKATASEACSCYMLRGYDTFKVEVSGDGQTAACYGIRDGTVFNSQTLANTAAFCPPNAQQIGWSNSCTCNAGFKESATSQTCVRPAEVKVKKEQVSKPRGGKVNQPKGLTCPPNGIISLGDPIYPLTGTERYPLETGLTVGGIALQLTYDTAKQKAATAASLAPKDFGDLPSFGGLWMSSLHKRLAIGLGEFGINAHRGDGHIVSFAYANGAYSSDADAIDQLKAVTGGYQLTAGDRKSVV